MNHKLRNSFKNLIAKFRKLKTWLLAVLLLVFLFFSATCLRFDHLRMSRLRSAVLTADAEGNDALLAENLNLLRDFTFSHVVVSLVEENGNSHLKLGTGPFYLEASYRRAAAAALEEVSKQEINDNNPNGNIYAAVGNICKPRAVQNGWSWDSPEHIACWTEELAKYPAEDVLNDTATAQLPSTELYRREYSSPLFCFSFTSIILFLTFLLLFVLVFRLIRFIALKTIEISADFVKKF